MIHTLFSLYTKRTRSIHKTKMSTLSSSLSSSSSSLNQIRESLASLESYTLPERYDPSQSNNTEPALPAELTRRYRQARDTYLRHRINDLILDHLSTLESKPDENGNLTLSLQLPKPDADSDPAELQQLLSNVKQDLYQNVVNLKLAHENVYYKYQSLMEKKERLKDIVHQLSQEEECCHKDNDGDANMQDVTEMDESQKNPNHNNIDNDNNDEDDNMEESELQLQEERLQSLLTKKSILEGKLRHIRTETDLVKHDIDVKKDRLVQLLEMNKDTTRPISPDTVLQDINLDEIEAETEKLREESAKYQDMSFFYESARLALEEISGVRILSIAEKEVSSTSSSSSSLDPHHDASSHTHDILVMKLLLLHKHTMEMHLVSSSASGQEEFKVSSAQLTSSPILSDTLPDSDENKNNPSSTVTLAIPPLDDLVSISKNFDSARGIRFVLQETLKRIRMTSDRVTELALLRSKYLTKITLPSSNKKYNYGGDDQEVICSINSSITVVIRLTPDCPRIKGSAYIYQIVGVGGWDEQVLQQLKEKVNESHSRSPIEVMDRLVDEVDALEQRGVVRIPTTPVLPAKHH